MCLEALNMGFRYLSHYRATEVQVSLRICTVSTEPSEGCSYTLRRDVDELKPNFRHVAPNQNCFGQFHGIPWNQTLDVH